MARVSFASRPGTPSGGLWSGIVGTLGAWPSRDKRAGETIHPRGAASSADPAGARAPSQRTTLEHPSLEHPNPLADTRTGPTTRTPSGATNVMELGRAKGAVLAQLLGQVLTGWSLVAHLAGWPDVSGWVVAFLIAALIVPFRHDGSLADRAAGNFGAACVLAGFPAWEALLGGLGYFGGGDARPGVAGLLILTAAVLFAVAGGLFWTLRERAD